MTTMTAPTVQPSAAPTDSEPINLYRLGMLFVVRCRPRLDSALFRPTWTAGVHASVLLLVSTILLGWTAYQMNRPDSRASRHTCPECGTRFVPEPR